jgi:predicted HTH domain antitoxin
MRSITVEVQIPEALRELGISDEEIRREVPLLLVLKRFRQGQVSSGKAAELLGISRRDFLDLLAKERVPIYDPGDQELTDELETISVPPGIQRSKDAFLRDLPELLANPKLDRWWAGYHLDQRVGIARTKTELVLEIERRGIGPEDYYVGIIRDHVPEPEEIESPDGRQFD